jgi:hypothetical protein
VHYSAKRRQVKYNLIKGAAQMEFTKMEIAILEMTENDVADEQIKQLQEFQLALIGGGVGEVIFG